MAHLVIEVARQAVERRLLALPIETDASGNPLDILAPPALLRRTVPTPFGLVRVQLIMRKVELRSVAGSSQSSLAITFDEGSIEALALGQAVGLLAGQVIVPFALLCRAGTVNNKPVAELCADFTSSNVAFNLDAPSHARLVNAVGASMATMIESAIAAALTAQFKSLGAQKTSLNFNYTPNVPSEDLLTVDQLPGVVWVNGEALALSLRYAPQAPFPIPFMPTPFLPAGNASAFGLQLSNDGFQRTVRNPAVRKLARDMLSARLLDGFVQKAYAARGGQDGITDQDRAEGRKALDDYLKTPQGQQELANETPSPVGSGKLRKRVKNVPDPFSDFDVEIPELDLWLGQDRIEGRAVAQGEVNGFGFTARVRFRARPALVQQPALAIEMRDIQVDDPDISIDLPVWLKWATGILVGLIAGPVIGVVVGFLLSAIISALAEALIPSNLGSYVPAQDPKPIKSLPKGVTLTELTVVPAYLQMLGRWTIFLDDPRPFYPTVKVTGKVESIVAGPGHDGAVWLVCLSALGVVVNSTTEGQGTPFSYQYKPWASRVTLTLESNAVPLPLTRFPWTVAVGHRSMAQYHFPELPESRQPLVAGALPVTAEVWHPEPPLKGMLSTQQFTIDVQGNDEDGFVLGVPPEAGCIVIGIWTKVIDASGQTWDLYELVDVANETVTFGSDFTEDFVSQCASERREWLLVEEPSLLDKLWNPPNVYSGAVQNAIRTEQPAVTTEIGAMMERHGREAYFAMLAPSLMQGRQ